MRETKEKVNSFIGKIEEIDASKIQEVYHFYRKHHRRYFYDYEKVLDSEEKKSRNKEAYDKINEKFQEINNRIDNRRKTTVFLSHSHKDFEYACRIALYLMKRHNVNVYIDELDSFMPLSTNSVTAKKISKKIREYDRFIFVGTKSSFKSKWCNWELGLADFKNSQGHLAFFVMNDHPEKNGKYRDNEYVELYPFIWDKEILGIESAEEELFVGYYKDFNDKKSFIPLAEWLKNDKKR